MEIRRDLRVDDAKIIQVHNSVDGHTLQDIGPDRTDVDILVQHGVHHIVMDAAENQRRKVLIWIDTLGFEFTPGHLKSAKRRFIDCHKPLAAKIFESLQIRAIPASKNHPAKYIVGRIVGAPIVHGGNARDPILNLKIDVDAGIHQDKIDRARRHRLIYLIKRKRHDRKLVVVEGCGKVIGRGGPISKGGYVTAVAENTDPNFFDRGRRQRYLTAATLPTVDGSSRASVRYLFSINRMSGPGSRSAYLLLVFQRSHILVQSIRGRRSLRMCHKKRLFFEAGVCYGRQLPDRINRCRRSHARLTPGTCLMPTANKSAPTSSIGSQMKYILPLVVASLMVAVATAMREEGPLTLPFLAGYLLGIVVPLVVYSGILTFVAQLVVPHVHGKRRAEPACRPVEYLGTGGRRKLLRELPISEGKKSRDNRRFISGFGAPVGRPVASPSAVLSLQAKFARDSKQLDAALARKVVAIQIPAAFRSGIP